MNETREARMNELANDVQYFLACRGVQVRVTGGQNARAGLSMDLELREGATFVGVMRHVGELAQELGVHSVDAAPGRAGHVALFLPPCVPPPVPDARALLDDAGPLLPSAAVLLGKTLEGVPFFANLATATAHHVSIDGDVSWAGALLRTMARSLVDRRGNAVGVRAVFIDVGGAGTFRPWDAPGGMLVGRAVGLPAARATMLALGRLAFQRAERGRWRVGPGDDARVVAFATGPGDALAAKCVLRHGGRVGVYLVMRGQYAAPLRITQQDDGSAVALYGGERHAFTVAEFAE